MGINDYEKHIGKISSINFLENKLSSLERITKESPRYSKEITQKIKIIKNQINKILKTAKK